MDRGAWQAAVHVVAKSSFHFQKLDVNVETSVGNTYPLLTLFWVQVQENDKNRQKCFPVLLSDLNNLKPRVPIHSWKSTRVYWRLKPSSANVTYVSVSKTGPQ